MDSLCERFKKALMDESLSGNTVSSYSGNVERFKEWCVETTNTHTSTLHRENFLDFRSFLLNVRKLSPNSINLYIASLAKYNEFLVREGIQDAIVIKKRDNLKIQGSITDPWNGKEMEVAQLRQSALTKPTRYSDQNKRDHAIVTVLANCGLRVSELINLRMDDTSLGNMQIRVVGKGGKTRVVFINDKTANAVKEYLTIRNPKSDSPYMFLSRQGPCLTRGQVNKILKKHSDDLHPHMLRHFYCSETQRKAGFTTAETANQAGHSNLRTTQRYTHPDKKEMKEKINKL